jgi:hypothetical protein
MLSSRVAFVVLVAFCCLGACNKSSGQTPPPAEPVPPLTEMMDAGMPPADAALPPADAALPGDAALVK